MAMMTNAKFRFNWLMLTLIFGIWASESPRAWRTTEKAEPDRVNIGGYIQVNCRVITKEYNLLLFIIIQFLCI